MARGTCEAAGRAAEGTGAYPVLAHARRKLGSLEKLDDLLVPVVLGDVQGCGAELPRRVEGKGCVCAEGTRAAWDGWKEAEAAMCTAFLAKTLAPSFSNISTQALRPLNAASWSAVNPSCQGDRLLVRAEGGGGGGGGTCRGSRQRPAACRMHARGL